VPIAVIIIRLVICVVEMNRATAANIAVVAAAAACCRCCSSVTNVSIVWHQEFVVALQ
jgi:hypothetical protein